MRRFVQECLNVVLIVLGFSRQGWGEGVLLSSRFIDGGVTGISMCSRTSLDFVISSDSRHHLPFIALAIVNRKTICAQSVLAIAGLSLCLEFIKYPDVTPDKLLTAVFGGFFIGAGIGLAMRGGAVLDGTEIAALLVSKSSNLLKVGDVILILNIFIFSAAAFFLGIESALYSILTYFAASKTIDFLIHGLEEYHAIIIVSDKSKIIRQEIIRALSRGVTFIKSRR